MIIAGIVAVLLVGPSLIVHGLIWLAGRPFRPAPARPVDPRQAGVAILVVARDEADRVLDALEAVRESVPAGHVHLVSNASTDGTAELADRLGAEVVATARPLTTAGATAAGLQAFRLLDRFSYVLVLDTGTRLPAGYLERALPLFADPGVAAVDARLAPDWLPPRRVLAAFRARRYLLTQSFGRGRVGPPATVARGLPAAGRIYRSAALARLGLDQAGAADDVDLSLRLYQRRLGRIALCPAPPAVTATSVRLREHVRRTRREVASARRADRRGWRGFLLAAQLLELLVAAAVVALVPPAVLTLAVDWPQLAPVRSVTGPVELALGFVLADYLLTVLVALAARQPRYLLAGLLFPLLRVVDAVAVLRGFLARRPASRTAPRAAPAAARPAKKPTPIPPPRQAPEPRPPARVRRRGWLLVAGWTLWTAAAAALVARVAWLLPTLPASSAEVALAEAGYERAAGLSPGGLTGQLAATDRQLAAYSWLADPFSRHESVLTGTRELSLVAVAVLLAALLLLTRALRLHPLVSAAPLAVLAAAGPAVAVFGSLGPGLLGAAWLGLAAVAAVRLAKAFTGDRLVLLVVTGLLTVATGLAAAVTAPVLIIPVGVAVAVWLWFLDAERYEPDLTWRGHAAVVLFLTGCVAAVVWRADLMLAPTGGVLAGVQRPALLAAATVAAGAGLMVKRARPIAAGTLTGVGLVGWFGAEVEALVPVLVAAAAVIVAMLLDAAARSAAPVVAGGLAAALTAAAAVAGLLIAPPAAPKAEHDALAGWVTDQVEAGGTLTVPPDIWADLHRDLSHRQPRFLVRRAGETPAEGLVVVHGRAPGAQLLGRFGSLTLVTTRLDPGYLDAAARVRAGTQLTRNERLTTSPRARAALLAGRVDRRAMAVLASLCAEHDVTLVRSWNPPHERGSGLPDRTIVLSTSDEATVERGVWIWLAAQEPPFAPARVQRTPEGIVLSWRLPRSADETTG